MLIQNLQTDLDDVYYSNAYFVMIESHLSYLKSLKDNQTFSITKQQNDKYEGDFYGLLNELNFEKRYHYPIMRINGLDNSNDFEGDRDFILVPSLQEVNLLTRILTSKQF
mgnify:CR=1 FL=1